MATRQFIDYFELKKQLDAHISSNKDMAGTYALDALTGKEEDKGLNERRAREYKTRAATFDTIKQSIVRMVERIIVPDEKPS